MSLPTRADVLVNCVPASCMPSPESPANRIVTRSSSSTLAARLLDSLVSVVTMPPSGSGMSLVGPRRQVQHLLRERLRQEMDDVERPQHGHGLAPVDDGDVARARLFIIWMRGDRILAVSVCWTGKRIRSTPVVPTWRDTRFVMTSRSLRWLRVDAFQEQDVALLVLLGGREGGAYACIKTNRDR